MNNKLQTHITSIVAEVLNLEPVLLNNQLRSQIPSWDSLKHMELLLRLEEEFQIRFSSREVAEIQSLDELVQIIVLKS
ncbi:MAG: phosphopantetheine-binding protein [Paenibacillaceae bacterium]